jgi:hypothetical protein
MSTYKWRDWNRRMNADVDYSTQRLSVRTQENQAGTQRELFLEAGVEYIFTCDIDRGDIPSNIPLVFYITIRSYPHL